MDVDVLRPPVAPTPRDRADPRPVRRPHTRSVMNRRIHEGLQRRRTITAARRKVIAEAPQAQAQRMRRQVLAHHHRPDPEPRHLRHMIQAPRSHLRIPADPGVARRHTQRGRDEAHRAQHPVIAGDQIPQLPTRMDRRPARMFARDQLRPQPPLFAALHQLQRKPRNAIHPIRNPRRSRNRRSQTHRRTAASRVSRRRKRNPARPLQSPKRHRATRLLKTTQRVPEIERLARPARQGPAALEPQSHNQLAKPRQPGGAAQRPKNLVSNGSHAPNLRRRSHSVALLNLRNRQATAGAECVKTCTMRAESATLPLDIGSRRKCYHSRYTKAFSQDCFGGIGAAVLRTPPVFRVDQLGWEVRDIQRAGRVWGAQSAGIPDSRTTATGKENAPHSRDIRSLRRPPQSGEKPPTRSRRMRNITAIGWLNEANSSPYANVAPTAGSSDRSCPPPSTNSRPRKSPEPYANSTRKSPNSGKYAPSQH